jgi:DNA polymerase type B, organellar and viral
MPRVSAEAIQRNRVASREYWRKQRDINPEATRSRNARKQKRRSDLEHRPFVGWDGEGYRYVVVDPDGTCDFRYNYMLFGCSTGRYITGKSLSTKTCLDLILSVERSNPDVFHIGFSFEYDVSMILKDLSWRRLALLKAQNHTIWKGYRIEHRPRKYFRVSRDGVTATIYDVFGFFHSNYLSALRKYKVGSDDKIRIIETGKAGRNRFTYLDLDEVTRYWEVEISLLPPLMDEIRRACYKGGFEISQWHGPGALATYALRVHKVKELYPSETPVEVQIAIQHAYMAGRFQPWRCGYYDGPVYTADINSAFMYAASILPRMDVGQWIRKSPDDVRREGIARFGLYKIKFDAGQESYLRAKKTGLPERPYPLFHRDKNYRLTWPKRVEGWYWSPEAELVAGSPRAEILEAWVFDDDGSHPLQWINEYYNERLKLQRAGDPAEKAFKWALASIYGKFAQRTGWDKIRRKAPPSHNLAYAGFITSWCRAAVFDAAQYAAKHDALVSIDTDGVTSLVPFDESALVNGIGDGLGQWKLEEFTGIFYWQTGVYWLREDNGEWKEPKTRGIKRGKLPMDIAIQALNTKRRPTSPARFVIRKTTFIGYRQALNGQFSKWRTWQEIEDRRLMGGSKDGKCHHSWVFCNRCKYQKRGEGPDNRMHSITQLEPDHWDSRPHPLPWLKNQPGLPENVFEMHSPIYGDDDLGDDD